MGKDKQRLARGHTPFTNLLTPTERNRLLRVEGVVFDVQRYSLHDGPGLRTDVFLKGCSLRCGWCSNPESQKLQPELSLFEHNCIACGQFEETCFHRYDGSDGEGPASDLVIEFNKRVALCPTGAVRWIGKRRTVGDIMREVRRDIPFYGEGGGLTLTGGEATMQPDLCYALLRLAKEEDISTAIETSGHTQWEVLARLLPYLDHILYDVKHIDNELHRTHTGQGNKLILSNLQQLADIGAPVTIRIPLIPGFNATEESLMAIGKYIQSLQGNLTEVDLLPFHKLGRTKYKALGRQFPWDGYERLAEKEVESLADVLRSLGFHVSVGGV